MASKKLELESKTYKNLKQALAGESQAALKYMFFSSKAKKDGYEEIAEILSTISHNEIQHAKIWYKILNDGIGSTLKNIKLAANGEKYEWDYMYKNFAKEAEEEGYEEIKNLFESIAKIEKDHEATYNKIIELLEQGKVFESDENCVWLCRNCGHIHVGKKPPEICPVCEHPKGFFEKR